MQLAAYPWFQRLDKIVHSGKVDLPQLNRRRWTGAPVDNHAINVAQFAGRFIHGIPIFKASSAFKPEFTEDMKAFVVAAYVKELLGKPNEVSGIRIRRYTASQVPTFWKRAGRRFGLLRGKAPLMGPKEITSLSANGFSVMSRKEFSDFSKAVRANHLNPALEQGEALRKLLVSRNILSEDGAERAKKILELLDKTRWHEAVHGTLLGEDEVNADPVLYRSALVIRALGMLQSLSEASRSESTATSDYAYNIACHAHNLYRRLLKTSNYYDLYRKLSDVSARVFYKRKNLLRFLPEKLVKFDYDDVAGLYADPAVKSYTDETTKLMHQLTEQGLGHLSLSRTEESAETFQELKDPWSVIEKYYAVWTRKKNRGRLEAPLGDKLTNPLFVHDLVRTRVILDNADDCYAFAKGKFNGNGAKTQSSGLEQVLEKWVEGGRITSYKVHQYRDYIASPKGNGYSALHVVVDVEVPGEHGKLYLFGRRRRMEFQVLTKEMWDNNERGTAHHEFAMERKSKGGVVVGAHAGEAPQVRPVNLLELDLTDVGKHSELAAGEQLSVGIRPWEESFIVKIRNSTYGLTGDDNLAYTVAAQLPQLANTLKKSPRRLVLLDELGRPLKLDRKPQRDSLRATIRPIAPGNKDEAKFEGFLYTPKEVMQLVPEHRRDEPAIVKAHRSLGKLLK